MISRDSGEPIEAIIACFRESSASSFERLANIPLDAWQQAEAWLDTSGMSFYFLEHLRAFGHSSVLPSDALQRLEEKLAQNRVRCADMIKEFLAINQAFFDEEISFINLKGFTLSPTSCPDIDLRRQADLDFLVDPQHLDSARKLLEDRGYVVTGSTMRTLEMKIGITLYIDSRGRCKPKPGRSVELHVSLESTDPRQRSIVRDERLSRVSQWSYNGEDFPALAPADQMLCQAVHILSHLRGERTRLSWLLEYRRHVITRQEDGVFWRELRFRAENDPDAMLALGLCNLLSAQILGAFAHPSFYSWTVDALPSKVRLWAVHFGKRAVLADAAGTKLYLLLENALADETTIGVKKKAVRRLIPMHAPERVLQARPNEDLRFRYHRCIVEFRFIWYRFRFHLRHGLLHLIEARRWRTLLKQSGHTSRPSRRVSSLQTTEDLKRFL